ncbi:MAG TPA: tRNA-dihydrouridine synthase [Candidatus Saccharimonadales bacterium]|nr:tRNA-dihydrouridine synthase [Candidatus Saccharimonadales bacterium]
MSDFLQQLPRPFFVLAPMDDVTDTVFRQIVADCASPNVFFTEFVNVDGLQSPGRPHLLKKIRKDSDKERPLIAQIWGKKPENYYKTAQELVEMGFDGIDINMGCPAKPVVQNGCCSALIENRPLALEIIKATQEGAANKIPVSVKTRLGFTQVDLTWHEFLLQQNLSMLTVHGRTQREMSAVPAHWDLIGEVSKMRSTLAPQTILVGNGDVESHGQGRALAAQYGLDGIMIGRGVFTDPFVFSTESPWPNYTRQQRVELFRKHVTLFEKTWGDSQPIAPLNKFCKVYISNFDGAKELREQLMDSQSAKETLDILNRS